MSIKDTINIKKDLEILKKILITITINIMF